jgi:phosphotransferase system enzyme I (PtsI)
MTRHSTKEVLITNSLGLHARAAAKIAALAQKAIHPVWLLHDGQKADVRDILDILSLEIPVGRTICFACETDEDLPVIETMTELVEIGFGEIGECTSDNASCQTLEGIAVSSGIAIGMAYVVYHNKIDLIAKYRISESAIPREVARFQSAIKTAREELIRIIETTADEVYAHTDILNTHVVMLNDRLFYGKILDTIAGEKINAEWALQKVALELGRKFSTMTDPYLKERALDIVHLADRVMVHLSGKPEIDIAGINRQVILITHDLSPAQATQIKPDIIKGVATDTGGRTSHAGIILRSLGIPTVMGLHTAAGRIVTDDLVLIDGTNGTLTLRPDNGALMAAFHRKIDEDRQRLASRNRLEIRNETMDGFRLTVMGNIEMAAELNAVIETGAEGIGLYRTEFQYLGRSDFPSEEELFAEYKTVAERMSPKPVTIRTLDINGDKALEHGERMAELNPALGFRAIRYCLKNPNVYKTQIRAILRAAAFGNLRMLIPMISSYEEIIETKRLIQACVMELETEKREHRKDVPLGIMIEVPSAAILADIMAEQVDFFSIGTNDLIQFALAIDRGNRDVAYLYSPLHPAMLRLIKNVIETGHQKGIPTYMCGEMAGDPLCVPLLLGLGIDELSMSLPSIGSIKRLIASLRKADAEALLNKALSMKTTEEIIDLMHNSQR